MPTERRIRYAEINRPTTSPQVRSYTRRSIRNCVCRRWLRGQLAHTINVPPCLKARRRLLNNPISLPRMRRHGTELVDVRQRMPQQRSAQESKDHSRPQKHHARDRTPVASVPHWTAIILTQSTLCGPGIHTSHVRALRSDYVRVCERAGKRERTREHGAGAPRRLHGA